MVQQCMKKGLAGVIIFFSLLLNKHGTLALAQQTQTLTIPEGASVGTVIGTIGDGLKDVPPPFTTIFGANQDRAVENDLQISENGVITTKVVLDREKTSQYSLFAIANSNQNSVKVSIKVLDINDNEPIFARRTLNIHLSESTPADSDYALGSATDKDNGINSTQGYEIVSGNEDRLFRLGTKRAQNDILFLDLEVNGTLDYETKSYYKLKIRAYDGGSPPKSGYMHVNIFIVDTNDNQPIFNQSVYSVKIAENVTVNTSILQVWATDQDSGENGHITYYIDDGNGEAQEHFGINPSSGVVYLNKKLDYEKQNSYELIVIAHDNGTQKQQTTAVVSISVTDVNDNQPEINVRFLTGDGNGGIPESSQRGLFLAQISVSDPDLPGHLLPVNVSLSGGGDKFGITKRNNMVYLIVLTQQLDSSTQRQFDLTVTATDMGNPPLRIVKTFTVYVTDTNNEEPYFGDQVYYADIEEGAPPGSSVIRVTANDNDEGSVISYHLLSLRGSHKDLFEINLHTGLITTKTEFLCENITQSKLLVTAEDSGLPPLTATATIILRMQQIQGNYLTIASTTHQLQKILLLAHVF